MKRIKIFLASSDELKPDRESFGNLVRKLDRIYEKRGVRIDLFEWEDYDAAYNNVPKQDEYDEQVRASDMFLALFHIKAGKFTIREFNVATDEFRKHASPKVYVYCKDLQPNEQESVELTEFKRVLYKELGHYWCRYGNSDTMQLHFVMQLQLVENNHLDAIQVDENGAVTLDGTPIAHMDNLPFAAFNKDYQEMSAELLKLPSKIEKARHLCEKYPENQDYQDDYQSKLIHYNQVKDEFKRQQNIFIATAKKIAELRYEHVNERLRRAIEAFENGNVNLANLLLEENEHEGDLLASQIERDHRQMHEHIESMSLQAFTVLSEVKIPIDKRIERVAAIYAKADSWAQSSVYEKEKYEKLIFNYARFLYAFGLYNDAERIYLRHIALCEELLGKDSYITAISYNDLGLVYIYLCNYEKAIEYHRMALDIRKRVLGEEHLETGTSYNNIGLAYDGMGETDKALSLFFKAIDIFEKASETMHPNYASFHNNIGNVYAKLDEYEKALPYYQKALDIREKVLGIADHETAVSYYSIGMCYHHMNNYDKAIEYCGKAAYICDQTVGTTHPDTAVMYKQIALICTEKAYYRQALEFFFKSLSAQEKTQGIKPTQIAESYNNIGITYSYLGEHDKAIEYIQKALAIKVKYYGPEHLETASTYGNLAFVLFSQGDYDKVLEYHFKALKIKERQSGSNQYDVAVTYNNIGYVYYVKGDYENAIEFYSRALSILEKEDPSNASLIASVYNNCGLVYKAEKDNALALFHFSYAYQIWNNIFGPNHPHTQQAANGIVSTSLNMTPEDNERYQQLIKEMNN